MSKFDPVVEFEVSDEHHDHKNVGLDSDDVPPSPRRNIAQPLSAMSIQLTQAQFERLYLQPSGQQSKGDLVHRLGNPTPIGIACFLIALMSFAVDLMNWGGTTGGTINTQIGAYYLCGGGAILAGIQEWICGNTFSSTFLTVYGIFFTSFSWVLDPANAVATTLGPYSNDFNSGLAIYLFSWVVFTAIMTICALRTNICFVTLFAVFETVLCMLCAAYWLIGHGNVAHVPQLLKAAGGLAFAASILGWYLLTSILFLSTGVPYYLPMGDLSGGLKALIARKTVKDEEKAA